MNHREAILLLGCLGLPGLALAADRPATTQRPHYQIVSHNIALEAAEITIVPKVQAATDGAAIPARRAGSNEEAASITGTLLATGCGDACPIRIPVSASTRYFEGHKEITLTPEALQRLNGRSGSFGYPQGGGAADSVHWSANP